MTDPIRLILDRAADEGCTVELWWRDDDATAPTPALDRLLALARDHGAAPAIAAIPADAIPALAARLREAPGTAILCHGWRHRNGAVAGAKPSEFGPDRPLAEREVDAAAGLAAIGRIGSALPVLVPPWNRIGPDLLPSLPALGFAGLSVFGPRRTVPGLRVVNTHLDPVDWRGTRGPVPPEVLARALAAALPSGEPIGLLTHHLVFDEALWSATGALADALGGHPAVRWREAGALWAAEASSDASTSPLRGGSSRSEAEDRGGGRVEGTATVLSGTTPTSARSPGDPVLPARGGQPAPAPPVIEPQQVW